MRLIPTAAIAATLFASACATTLDDCDCEAAGPAASIVEAVPLALEAICTISPGARDADSLRADASEHGFEYWGEFFEYAGPDGTVDVRPGPDAGDPCKLEFMVDHNRGQAVDRALTAWATNLDMTGARSPATGSTVASRAYAGEAGALAWTYTPSVVAGEPAVIVADLDLAVE